MLDVCVCVCAGRLSKSPCIFVVIHAGKAVEITLDVISFGGGKHLAAASYVCCVCPFGCVCAPGIVAFANLHTRTLRSHARTNHTHSAYGLFEFFGVTNTRLSWTNLVLLFYQIKRASEWANSADRNNWSCLVCACASVCSVRKQSFFSSLGR